MSKKQDITNPKAPETVSFAKYAKYAASGAWDEVQGLVPKDCPNVRVNTILTAGHSYRRLLGFKLDHGNGPFTRKVMLLSNGDLDLTRFEEKAREVQAAHEENKRRAEVHRQANLEYEARRQALERRLGVRKVWAPDAGSNQVLDCSYDSDADSACHVRLEVFVAGSVEQVAEQLQKLREMGLLGEAK